jgi:hypothetical protein
MNKLHRARILLGLGGMLLVSACTPADVAYCRDMGVEGTAEYAPCLAYSHKQEAWFEGDRGICDLRADATYPQSLDDRGSYTYVHGGFDYLGRSHGMKQVYVGPDATRNAELHRLREGIIAPCMQEKGWVSSTRWQAGRLPVAKARGKKTGMSAPAPLPWLH